MGDKPLTLSPFRAKPTRERLVKGEATPPTHVEQQTQQKPGYEESVRHHEDRARDVHQELGTTLDETRNQSVTRHDNSKGAAALLLQEKASTQRPSGDDAARFDVLAALHRLRKETRGEGNATRELVDLVQRSMTAGASTLLLTHALEMLPRALQSDDVRTLLAQPALHEALRTASLQDPSALLTTLLHTPAAAAQQLAALVSNPRFQASDADTQLGWLAAFRVRVNLPPHTQVHLERFLASDAFVALPGDVKAQMYRVVRETDGDAAIIDQLVRVAESPSFQQMSVSSKMSFAAVVGTTLQRIRTGTELQQTVLRNSLERLLEPGGIPVALVTLPSSTLGMAEIDAHRIVINREFSLADFDAVDHLATHTLAHEVNHILNEPNEIAPPYERFMGEYRAWCVGFVAEHGRWPTCGEGAERIDHLLDVEGGYKGIARAALGSDDDAKKIRGFAQRFVTTQRDDDAPRPDPPGDLLNEG